MYTCDYWLRPTNLAFHDLTTSHSPPRNLRSLLGLGLKFIPTPFRTTKFTDLLRPGFGIAHLERSLRLCCFFLTQPPTTSNYNPNMYIPSNWSPPDQFFPRILRERIHNFSIALRQEFRPRKSIPNLSPHHRYALETLRHQQTFLVVNCDKNLGPAIIERERYIQLAFRDHLSDATTYANLSPSDALHYHNDNELNLCLWLAAHKNDLSPAHFKYLVDYKSSVVEPFPQFYLLMKVHKSPLKTRPIVSYSGSLFYGLGKWVDSQLQIVALTFCSYIQSSFSLKAELDALSLPSNCHLFTADATSMYTNIHSRVAIPAIHEYLLQNHHRFPSIPIDALISALRLIMDHNIFQFGDTFWKQLSGTAMGAPPAPPYATASFGIHEETLLTEFSDNLLYYRRYIDDVFGIWHNHPDSTINAARWTCFVARLNDWPGLEWTVADPCPSVPFLDLSISLTDQSLMCCLYQKPMNLHLYIPPRSAHPPGVLQGLISGWVYRSLSLCTLRSDAIANIQSLWKYLVSRGYHSSSLRPLFAHSFRTVRPFDLSTPTSTSPTSPDNERFWLFKLRFHPQDPSSATIQRAWERNVSTPPLRKPLANVDINYNPIGSRRFIVCYKRAPNLGNLLSYRKLQSNSGPPVSSYLHLSRDV